MRLRLRNMKVRLFPGSTIEDMYLNIYPLLRKNPTNIFLVIGTNNAKTDNSVQVAEKLVKLREYILSIIPTCIVIISPLINRYDHAKAQLTVTKVNELLSKMNIPIIDNSNITRDHLGKKGHHVVLVSLLLIL